MMKWFVTGTFRKFEFQHLLEIEVKGDYKVTTEAATRAEAERKIRLILEPRGYKLASDIKAELI